MLFVLSRRFSSTFSLFNSCLAEMTAFSKKCSLFPVSPLSSFLLSSSTNRIHVQILIGKQGVIDQLICSKTNRKILSMNVTLTISVTLLIIMVQAFTPQINTTDPKM